MAVRKTPTIKYPAVSILCNLRFLEALLFLVDAETSLEFNQEKPNSPYRLQLEQARGYQASVLAEVIDTYCQRRIAAAVKAAEKEGGVA